MQFGNLLRSFPFLGNQLQLTCSQCLVLGEKLTEMKTSEENRIKQLEGKHKDEIDGYKKKITELGEAYEQEKKREEVLIKEKNEIKKNNDFNKHSANNDYFKQLIGENDRLKLEIESKSKELDEVKIELDNLLKKNETKRLRCEMEEWKSNCQTFKEDVITRNKGRKY